MDNTNKIVSALMNKMQQAFQNVETKVTVDATDAKKELNELTQGLVNFEQQMKATGGAAFDSKIAEAFKNAKTQVQEYINFIDTSKDKLELSEVTRNAAQNFEQLKNKITELNQVISGISSNQGFDDLTRKLNDIKNVDFDISEQAKKFTSRLNEMEQSVESLKNNVQDKLKSVDFSQIGGDNSLNDLDRKLDDILQKVQDAKNKVNGEVGKMLSGEDLSTDNITQKLDSFVSDMTKVGEDVEKVSKSILNTFGDLFGELSSKVDIDTISSLKELSSVLTALNDNNIEIKNPLAEIITALEQISDDKIEKLDSLNRSLSGILNIPIDGDGTAHQLLELATGIELLNSTITDDKSEDIRKLSDSLDSLTKLKFDSTSIDQLVQGIAGLQDINNVVNSLEKLSNMFQPGNFSSMADQFKEMNKAAQEMASSLNNMPPPSNNFNNNMPGPSPSGQISPYTGQPQQNTRAEDFYHRVSNPLEDNDFDDVDHNSLKHANRSHRSSHIKMGSQSSKVSRNAHYAKLSNMSGGGKLNSYQMSDNKLDDIADISRELEAEMAKIVKLREQFDEAVEDPNRQDEATDKARAMNKHQLKLNNLGKELANSSKISKKDMKNAPPEVKQVHESIVELMENTKGSNTEMMRMNDMMGLDELNDDLSKSNNELDRAKKTMSESKWDNFKSGVKGAGDAIKTSISDPLDKVSGILKGGMGMMGFGSLAALASNPLSINGALSIAGKLVGDMSSEYQNQGVIKADSRQMELMAYGSAAGSNGAGIIDEGIALERSTHGRIKHEELSSSYQGLTRNVVGQIGQDDGQNQTDMKEFAEVGLMMQKGWGIGEGQAQQAISIYYKDLGKNVKETEYELAKIGQTASSLNVPFDKHLEMVTSMALQYKTIGFEADFAGNILGNLQFEHGMSAQESQKMAGNVGQSLAHMPEGWLAYGAGMTGNMSGGDPLQTIVDLQYGFNDDGTLKEGVAEKQAEIFTSNYQMMQGLGGSAGDYASIKILNQMGITDKKEVAKFLNHADDPEYLTNLFKDQAGLGTTDQETGETKVDKDDPLSFFTGLGEESDSILSKLSEAADELSGIDKTISAYETGISDIVLANDDLFDTLTTWDEEMAAAMEALGGFVGGLSEFIENLQEWYDRLDNMLGNDLGEIIAGAVGAAMLASLATNLGAGYVMKKIAKKAFSSKKKKKSSSSDDDDDDKKKKKNKKNGNEDEDDDEDGKKKKKKKNSTPDADDVMDDLDDADGNKKGRWKNILGGGKVKGGTKGAIIAGGIATIGGLLFGNPDIASADGGGEGGDGGSDSGFFGGIKDKLAGLIGGGGDKDSDGVFSPITDVLKEILAVLSGGATAIGAEGYNGNNSGDGIIEKGVSKFFENVNAQMVAMMAAGGFAVGAYASHNKNKPKAPNRKEKAAAKIAEDKNKRQSLIDEDDAKKKAKLKADYDLNRKAGMNPSEAMDRAKKQAELEKTFKSEKTTLKTLEKPRAEAKRKVNIKNHYDLNRKAGMNATESLERARRSVEYDDIFKSKTTTGKLKSFGGKQALKMLKPIPLLGNIATLGLGAYNIKEEWDNQEGLQHMTGQNTAKGKSRAIADEASSMAIIGAAGALGSIFGPLGTLGGMGAGMWIDGKLEKSGAKDWVADKFGMGNDDIAKDQMKSIDKDLKKEAERFAKRMDPNGEAPNNDYALIAASALQKNAKDLSGLSQDKKDIWAMQFTEEYLKQIADGVSPEKAEKAAEKSANKLDALKTGQDEMNAINTDQLAKMLDLYEMSGANKESLDDYSKTYFKNEKDAKKVLDATSKATGLSVDELKTIAASMDLLPEQLASLIAKGSGGKEKVEDNFDNADEMNKVQKELKKSGMTTGQADKAIEAYKENIDSFKENKLTDEERLEWLKDYGTAEVAGKNPLQYANEQTNMYRKTAAAWEKGGILDGYQDTLTDGNWKSYYGETKFKKGQTAQGVIGNFADKAGLSSQDLNAQIKKSGVSEDKFAKYLLANSGEDGKFSDKEVKNILSKNSDYAKITIEKLESGFKDQLLAQKTSDLYAGEVSDLEMEKSQSLTDELKEKSQTIHEDGKEFSSVLNEGDQKFRDEMQAIKITADAGNASSIVDALTSLGGLFGEKIMSLAETLASLVGGGSMDGIGGGDLIDQVATMIGANEGDYESVNKNDNGALSIGKLQWHGNRAKDLLKTIQEDDPQAYSLATRGLGIKSLESDWSNYTVNQSQADAISKLLEGEAGKKAQDDLIRKDISKYIEHGKELGITDSKALAYLADIENQGGAGAANRIVRSAGGAGSTLDELHDAAMKDSVMGGYSTRRKKAYADAKNVNEGGIGGGFDGDVASYYLSDTFTKTSTHHDPNRDNHKGVDLAARAGTDLFALAGGTVKAAGYDKSAGNFIAIEHADKSITKYFHMLEKTALKVGDKVSKGQQVGDVGSTGNSTGPHLHLEYWKNGKDLDPIELLKKLAGMGGAIGDPSQTGGDGSGYHDHKATEEAKTLKRGSKGNSVKTLQQSLKALGFDPKGIDGSFGKNTEAALKAFEKSVGAKVDGIFDKKTLQALEKALEKNTESTDNSTKKKSSSSSDSSSSTSTANKAENQQAHKPILTNLSAYNPFSGIHPTTGKSNYNQKTFDLYKQKGIKSSAENDSGVNLQDFSRDSRKAFDVKVKASVDPTQHPNFVQLVDKHMKVAVANAVKEATESLSGNYNEQFEEIWRNMGDSVNKNKSID